MLRLERRNRQEVSVVFGPSRGFWSRSLLMAFLIALCLHLVGFVLFRLHELVHKGDRILSPTEVEIDLSSAVTTSVALAQANTHFLFEPTFSSPELPESLNLSQRLWELDSNHLAPLEKSARSDYAHQLHLFGDIADLSLIHEPIQTRFKKLPPGEYWNVFAVQVDHQSGKIFWEMRQDTNGVFAFDIEAEKLLHELQFKADPTRFVSSGYIEIRAFIPRDSV